MFKPPKYPRLADEFADLACLCYSAAEHVDRRRCAAALLAGQPELIDTSVFAAAAAFDVEALRARLDWDPGCANEAGGPRRWPPLLYLAYSRIEDSPPERAERLASVLAEEPGLLDKRRDDGATLTAAAEETGDAEVIAVLKRFGQPGG